VVELAHNVILTVVQTSPGAAAVGGWYGNLLIGLRYAAARGGRVWLVRASLRPLRAMERTAVAIAGGDLAQRVPELIRRHRTGPAVGALNTMLAQIEKCVFLAGGLESAARAAESSARRPPRIGPGQ